MKHVTIKSKKDIAILREGGCKLAAVLQSLGNAAEPGISTEELDKLAMLLIKKAGGEASFLNYKHRKDDVAYPSAICASINEEVVHCPADPKKMLKKGDIIGIDVGMKYKGLYTDTATTFAVGVISPQKQKLLDVTQKSLDLAIKKVCPGVKLSEIGSVIQDYVKRMGFSVVYQLVGHGVGYEVHELPQVPNFKPTGQFNDMALKEGMVIAIEPMVNMGRGEVKFLDDGWKVATADGSLSAHFEHTIAVTKKGAEVLTIERISDKRAQV